MQVVGRVNKEQGAIPLNYKKDLKPLGTPIGLNAGAMRTSTGYAFSQIIHQAINVGKQLKQGQTSSDKTWSYKL